LVTASPWFWPPVGLAAVGAAGWALGPAAAWVVLAGIGVLVLGFVVGLSIAGGVRRERQSPAKATSPGTPTGRRVILRGANLRNADLRGADLSGADMEGADLRGANLAPLADDA
jgi:hypothetical protein